MSHACYRFVCQRCQLKAPLSAARTISEGLPGNACVNMTSHHASQHMNTSQLKASYNSDVEGGGIDDNGRQTHKCCSHVKDVESTLEQRRLFKSVRSTKWLRWLQLLYMERRLHRSRHQSARVAPLEVLLPGQKVEINIECGMRISVVRGGTLRWGRLKSSMLANYPRGAFVRGKIVKQTADATYSVDYEDGPYGYDDSRAPPPGYERSCVDLDIHYVRLLGKRCTLTEVPRSAISVVAEPATLYLPVACAVLGLVHLTCFVTWRYLSNVHRPGPRSLYYQLVSDFPGCKRQTSQVWRLASYQLVHVSLLHVAANWFMLLVFGSPIEITHGHLPLLVLYETGVVSGALVCAWVDSYDAVVGSSGGTYALFGAHAASIFKDWDRLKRGLVNRRVRLSLFSLVLTADFMAWYITRPHHVSYAAHFGGAGAGLLLGVLVLRRRAARSQSKCISRLKRPAFLLALILFVLLASFSVAWYILVYPPRPLSYAWYHKETGRKYWPCCIQLLDCNLHPSEFLRDILRCDYDNSRRAFTLTLGPPPRQVARTCDDLRDYQRSLMITARLQPSEDPSLADNVTKPPKPVL